MNELCDVNGCQSLPLLGWRPLTERLGRQICEYHWHRHRDKKDSFDLFDTFKFRRPVGIRKSGAQKYVPRLRRGRDTLRCRQCGWERRQGIPTARSVAKAENKEQINNTNDGTE